MSRCDLLVSEDDGNKREEAGAEGEAGVRGRERKSRSTSTNTVLAVVEGTQNREKENEEDRWLARRQEVDEKRRDMEAHYHKNIWTKDPHGGRYRRSTGPDARSGYDALEETKDGSKVEPELGYEKPQIGPTSNFVGNHMTQGAIDLIQSQLSRRDRAHEKEKLQRYQSMYHPPKKLTGEMAGNVTTKTLGLAKEEVMANDEKEMDDKTAKAVQVVGPPDLKLLRLAIREQRKKKKPGDGKLFDENVLLQQQRHSHTSGKEEGEAEAEAEGEDFIDLDIDQIEAKLEELLGMGDYGKAAKYYTHALDKLDAANFEKRSHMLLKRSWCFSQTGEMKKAISDAEECNTLRVQGLEEETLVALAKLYESVEDYQKAMDCLTNLSKINPSHSGLSRLSFIRRSVKQQEKHKSRRNSMGTHSTLFPSIPRKTLPRFENRGKSGAAF